MIGRKKGPQGGIVPKDIGLPFKEIPKIYIGTCGAKGTIWEGTKNWLQDGLEIAAHTHTGKDDPYTGCVCVYRYEYVFNSDYTPSDIMWHEYGHVITEYSDITRAAGQIAASTEGENGPTFQDVYHGPEWKETMKRLGKTPRRSEYLPY